MVETLQQIDLRKNSVLEIFIICEGSEVDLLDCYFFLAFSLDTLIDFAVYTFTEALGCLVGVVTNDFNHDFSHS